MDLSNALPAVCSALGGNRLLAEAGVSLVSREGPANSTTTLFSFDLNPAAFDPNAAEAVLRDRYGQPMQESSYMVSFQTPDGRQLALDRRTRQVTLWLEADSGSPSIGNITRYESTEGRHSNLPPRLRHNVETPQPVMSVKLENRPDLEELLGWYDNPHQTIDRAALARLRDIFLERFPDFLPAGFDQTKGGYYKAEDAYKRSAVNHVQELLRAEPPLDDEALGDKILETITAKDFNLLGNFRVPDRIRTIVRNHPGALETATGSLARDSRLPEEAVQAFLDVAWPLLEDGQDASKPYADSRILPTLVLALARPIDAMAIRYQPNWNAGMQLLKKSLYANAPLSRDEHAETLKLAQAVFQIMRDEWFWNPRDLWDVQGFIWVTCRTKLPADSEQAGPGPNSPMTTSTNLILYGPPGTGKTYTSVAEAVRLCDGHLPPSRNELVDRYNTLVEAGQVAFVTFHQSYSYEDFIEGLRPTTGDDDIEATSGFNLVVRPGLFRELAALAEQARKTGGRVADYDLSGRQVFKMSLGRAGIEDHIYDAAIEGSYIVGGWGGQADLTDERYKSRENIERRISEISPEKSNADVSLLDRFRNGLRLGDIVVVSEGNRRFRAIGEVTGPYRFAPTGERHYNHCRDVRWLLVLEESLPVDRIYAKAFNQLSCYRLVDSYLKKEALSRLLATSTHEAGSVDQFVLVIDEINRANISKVFGELITLIEPDKRLGQPGALSLRLPYSGEDFSVPDNLHIVGTMNTADRSIALLDTALRRRFEFKELMPLPELLDGATALTGVDLVGFLAMLNDRIEYLFDREHQIGHAYFMGCASREDLDFVMRNKVIPLLTEYFYEDWSKVALVLGDAEGAGRFVDRVELKPPPGFENESGDARWRWVVKATFSPDAYSLA